MSWRFLGLFSCGLALAVACGSDDDNQQPAPEEAGGAAGEAGSPSSAGSSTTPTAGSGGSSGGSAGSSVGGEPSVAGAAAGGDSSAAGAAGAGGIPNEPGPVSACGADKYETGDGCAACPPLPTSGEPTYLNCGTFDSALKDELTLTVAFKDVELHEPLGGEVSVSWVSSDTMPGGATVPWQYSPAEGQFSFELPLDARYAVEFTFAGWTFTDACGFPFSGTLRVAEAIEGGWICALN